MEIFLIATGLLLLMITLSGKRWLGLAQGWNNVDIRKPTRPFMSPALHDYVYVNQCHRPSICEIYRIDPWKSNKQMSVRIGLSKQNCHVVLTTLKDIVEYSSPTSLTLPPSFLKFLFFYYSDPFVCTFCLIFELFWIDLSWSKYTTFMWVST